MNRIDEILVWLADHYGEDEFSPGAVHEAYSEDADHDPAYKTFQRQLSTLAEKGLLDRPSHGKYIVSSRGHRRAKNLTGEDEIEEDQQIPLQEDIAAYLMEEQDALNTAVVEGRVFTLRFSELDRVIDCVEEFEENPGQVLAAVDEAVSRASDADRQDYRLVVDVDYWQQPLLKARSAEQLGNPVTVEGVIEAKSDLHPEITAVEFECVSCGAHTTKQQNDDAVKSPYQCDCGNRKFDQVETEAVDRVDFSIVDLVGYDNSIGAVYRTDCFEEAEQKKLKPGKEVRVTGVVRDAGTSGVENTTVDPVLDVIDIEEIGDASRLEDIKEAEREQIRKRIDELGWDAFNAAARSIAPHIHGQQEAKQVLAAGLLGGAPRRNDGEVVNDGRIHVLLLSNPGLGKSEMLEFIENRVPRSFYATGQTSTGVGLTAAVEQEENGGYRVVVGKLVYADGGWLCLDEFDKLHSDDATHLNQAMTDDHFTVDKAGKARLPGQATVLAAGNFENPIDAYSDVVANLPDHAESVLDRFDLIYAMRRDDDADAEDAILGGFQKDSPQSVAPEFTDRELSIYLEMARDIDPILSNEARKLLREYINVEQEVAASRQNTGFQTDSYRHVVALGKLATMSARSRLAEEADNRDARRAIRLFRACRSSLGIAEGQSVDTASEIGVLQRTRQTVEDLTENRKKVHMDELVEEVDGKADQVREAVRRLRREGEIIESDNQVMPV